MVSRVLDGLFRLSVALNSRILRSKVHRAKDLKLQVLNCLTWHYLSANPEFPWGESLESERSILVAATARFLDWPLGETIQAETERHGDVVEKVIVSLKTLPAANELKAKALLADAYLAGLLADLDKSDERGHRKEQANLLKQSKDLSPDLDPLDDRTLVSTLNDVRLRTKNFERRYRLLRIPRMSISAKDVTFVLSLASTLFLVSGYLYTQLLLWRFDIDSSYFFGLTDCLAASLDEIRSALFGSLAGIVGLWVGRNRQEVLTGDERKLESEKDDTRFHALVFICAVGYVAAYLRTESPLMLTMGVTLTACIVFFRVAPLAARYIEKPNPTVILFASYWVFAFLFFIAQAAIDTAIKVKDPATKPSAKYTFTVAGGGRLPDTYRVITASSSHFLFFDITSGQTVVLKQGDITQVIVAPEDSLREK